MLPIRPNIAFKGPKHSGKSTASRVLTSEFGYKRFSLADPIKDTGVDMVNAANARFGLPPIDRAFLDAHKDEVFVPLLQWLGTEYGRRFYDTPLRWIDLFLNDVVCSGEPAVCDDLRYLNEAAALHDAGFVIVEIRRNEAARVVSLVKAKVPMETASHASETELQQIVPDIVLTPAENAQGVYTAVRKMLFAMQPPGFNCD